MLTPDESAQLNALLDKLRVGGGPLILPPGTPAPVPQPPKVPVDWTSVRVQLFHILQILLTIGVAVISGYAAKYGVNATGAAEQAAQQSAANAELVRDVHADNAARIAAVHRDVKQTETKVDEVKREAAAPRGFLPKKDQPENDK